MCSQRNSLARAVGMAAAFALVLSATSTSSAQGNADAEAATGVYQAAVAVYAKGYFRVAIDLFVEANRLRPSASLSFNIARCYEQLDDPRHALAWYRDYLQRSKDPRDAVQVRRRVARLEKRLGRKGAQQVRVAAR